jgi:hypothetical protein
VVAGAAGAAEAAGAAGGDGGDGGARTVTVTLRRSSAGRQLRAVQAQKRRRSSTV